MNIHLFPSDRMTDSGRSIVSFHMEVILANISLGQIHKFQQRMKGAAISTAKSRALPSATSSRKEADSKQALHVKLIQGDTCMSAGAHIDASTYYSEAVTCAAKMVMKTITHALFYLFFKSHV